MDSIRLIFQVVFTNNTAIGLLLVLGICGVGVAAAVMAVSHLRRYSHAETNYLKLVKANLRSLRNPAPESASESAPASESGAPAARTKMSMLVSALELASAVPPESIIGDRLHTIALVRQSQTKVNLGALQQISRAR